MKRKKPTWTSHDQQRMRAGLKRIAELGTNADGNQGLLTCEAIARDLLNQRHGVWQWGLAQPKGFKSPCARQKGTDAR